MKNLLLLCICLLSLPVFSQRIGYVDIDTILTQLRQYQFAEKQLADKESKWAREFEQKVKILKQERLEYQKQVQEGQISQADQQTKIQEYREQEQSLLNERHAFKKKLKKKRVKLIQPLKDQIMEQVRQVAEEYQFDLIYTKNEELYRRSSAPIYDMTWVVKGKITDQETVLPFDPNQLPETSESEWPKLEFLSNGGIRLLQKDGSYMEYRDGIRYYYDPETDQIYTTIFTNVQAADIPKPITSFSSNNQKTWLEGLTRWIELLAQDRLEEIKQIIRENDEPNYDQILADYMKKEQEECSNPFETLNYRHRFLSNFYTALNSKNQ